MQAAIAASGVAALPELMQASRSTADCGGLRERGDRNTSWDCKEKCGGKAGEANSYIFDTKLFQLARPLLLQFKIAHLLPLAGGRHRLHSRGHFA